MKQLLTSISALNKLAFNHRNYKIKNAERVNVLSRILPYKSSRIHYLTFGEGNKLVVCFHGYGENAEAFAFLGKQPKNEFRYIAIDLPFHGKTKWNEGLNFTIEDLRVIVRKIIDQSEGLISKPGGKIILMGFSLGGRMVLHLYQEIAQNVDKIVMLAPDGLKLNFWYWLSTQTWLGERIFYFTMKRPGWFFGFLKILNGLRFVNKSIFKFVNYYIADKEIRDLLYNRWISLRKIRPSLNLVREQVRKFGTKIILVYGKHDRIILPVRGEKFAREIKEYCELRVIESGHQVLHEKHVKDILSALSS